jgi:hypothetical protein
VGPGDVIGRFFVAKLFNDPAPVIGLITGWPDEFVKKSPRQSPNPLYVKINT